MQVKKETENKLGLVQERVTGPETEPSQDWQEKCTHNLYIKDHRVG